MLVTQINRILTINKQTHLIPEAVDAAHEALLIGRQATRGTRHLSPQVTPWTEFLVSGARWGIP
ncbi:hypothetical protein [Neomicrococcus lactis]|uniref:hypothetical protein n=1 Tax=Neomicrococcus lactis TaxID=732241 RepID=UPI002300AFFE|nr:hypothetical protein [Neomicrococcus lactis]